MKRNFKVLVTILSCAICFGVMAAFSACTHDDGSRKIRANDPIIGTWIGDLPDSEYMVSVSGEIQTRERTNCKIYIAITYDKEWASAGQNCYRMDIYRRYWIPQTEENYSNETKYRNFSIGWPEVELEDNQYYYNDSFGERFDFNKKTQNTGYIFTLSGDTVTVTMADGTDDTYTLTRTTMTVEEFQQLDVSNK